MKANYSNNWYDVFVFTNVRTNEKQYVQYENKSTAFCLDKVAAYKQLILEKKLPEEVHFKSLEYGDAIMVCWDTINENTNSGFRTNIGFILVN